MRFLKCVFLNAFSWLSFLRKKVRKELKECFLVELPISLAGNGHISALQKSCLHPSRSEAVEEGQMKGLKTAVMIFVRGDLDA